VTSTLRDPAAIVSVTLPAMRPQAVLLSLGLLSACTDASTGDEASATETGATETSGDAPPDFDAEIQPILEAACICHFSATPGGDMTAPYLNFNAGLAVGELVEVDSVQVPSMKRVTPGDLETSYLVHKLRGTHVDVGAPVDTDPMPPLAPLPEADIARIEAWILAGALP
jgi:hypothetical protein